MQMYELLDGGEGEEEVEIKSLKMLQIEKYYMIVRCRSSVWRQICICKYK